MSKNSPVGLSLEEIHAQTLAELAGDAPEAATTGTDGVSEETSTEQPAGQSESDEEVNLFAALDEGTDDDNNEQPSEDSSVTINGETVSFDELKQGYLRQSDYTKKTQELATKTKELEDAKTLWDAFAADPQGTMDKLARQIGWRQGQTPKAADVDVNSLVEAKVQELLSSDPRLVEFQQQQAAVEEAAAFAAIESDLDVKLSDNDKARAKAKATELGLDGRDGLRTATLALYAEAQAAAARRKNLAGTSTSRGHGGKGGVPSAQVELKIPESIEEAFEMAQAEAAARS